MTAEKQPSRSTPRSTPRTTLGQYKIVRTLGAGGMGAVYLGEHLLLGRRAAIKTLLPALAVHREIVDRFFTEARAISAISDPGVVQIYDFGYHVDGTAYIVMEYLEGENLASRLERLEKLSLVESLRLTRQIASSLYAAHERGIIHRDLKPGNVFVISDSETPGGERAKILDFGICKFEGADATTTQVGVMLGTPVYMSPEQCRGEPVDGRADLYSVGCALFHMLTGRPPFACDNAAEHIAAHLKETPVRPSTLESTIPAAVDELVMRCLQKRADDRFQSMRDLQAAVDDVIATLSDPGRPAPAIEIGMVPLAEGYRSDVQPAPLAASKFSFSDRVRPAEDHAWEPPRDRGMSLAARALLVLVLCGAIIGGLAWSGSALSDDGAKAATTPAPPPLPEAESETPQHATAAHAQEPAPPPALDIDDADSTLTQDAPIKPPKPQRPPPERKWHPQPRRHVPPARPPQPKLEDDLYDTR